MWILKLGNLNVRDFGIETTIPSKVGFADFAPDRTERQDRTRSLLDTDELVA
jgi:hypothetical protein